jgi:hypothetical protein
VLDISDSRKIGRNRFVRSLPSLILFPSLPLHLSLLYLANGHQTKSPRRQHCARCNATRYHLVNPHLNTAFPIPLRRRAACRRHHTRSFTLKPSLWLRSIPVNKRPHSPSPEGRQIVTSLVLSLCVFSTPRDQRRPLEPTSRPSRIVHCPRTRTLSFLFPFLNRRSTHLDRHRPTCIATRPPRCTRAFSLWERGLTPSHPLELIRGVTLYVTRPSHDGQVTT